MTDDAVGADDDGDGALDAGRADETGDGEAGAEEAPLALVVSRERTGSVIDALEREGVYDDGRHVEPAGDGAVAVPVTAPPETVAGREVVRQVGERRLRTLEDHLRSMGWDEAERERAPGSWAVVGDVILVRMGDAPRPAEVGEALLALHGEADTVLAREGIEGPHRKPQTTVVAGSGDTETIHREHGTAYALDLAKVMFSPGNKAERTHIGDAVQPGERVLDMFAGVGYFTLPAARAGGAVTAVERNPTAFRYLVENASLNGVTDRIHPYRGDCRDVVDRLVAAAEEGAGKNDERTGDEGTDDEADGERNDDEADDEADDEGGDAPAVHGPPFDRVVMGYYDAHEYLDVAMAAVAPGGIVHVHEATPAALVYDRPESRVRAAAADAGRSVTVLERRTVKTHSEGVDHVVLDVRVD